MPSHPIDFQLQADIYSTRELRDIFDEERRFSRWLAIESALADGQAELGIIPREAAAEIGAKANLAAIDFPSLQQGYRTSRNSIIPLLQALRAACKEGLGEYVHFGATTQDILDTSQCLEIREVLRIIFHELLHLEDALAEFCRRHITTPMIGRTHGQQAMPITFGMKSAIWLTETRRHIERIKDIAPRVLTGQLSGAVGSMAALGSKAPELGRLVMQKLGLGFSPVPWHNSRDNIAELACCWSMIASSTEKIANEIYQLGKTEIFELSETVPAATMSSSTMPHKRNPVLCQRIAVLARHVRPLAATVVEAMTHEHERDTRCLWSEWLAMPQIAIYTGTALNYLNKVLAGLEIHENRMLENLHMHRELVVSEYLLFRLAENMGKMAARKKIHDIIVMAEARNTHLKMILAEDEETSGLLTEEDYRILSQPELYRGQAEQIVAAALAYSGEQRKTDPEDLTA